MKTFIQNFTIISWIFVHHRQKIIKNSSNYWNKYFHFDFFTTTKKRILYIDKVDVTHNTVVDNYRIHTL